MGEEFEGFTAGQLISFASEVTVSIVPRVSFPQLRLITGVVGPFSPGVSSQVPFWLFEFLHKTRRCTLEPPDWLSPQELSNLIQEEEENDRSFALLPTKHFFTIVYKLLNIADSGTLSLGILLLSVICSFAFTAPILVNQINKRSLFISCINRNSPNQCSQVSYRNTPSAPFQQAPANAFRRPFYGTKRSSTSKHFSRRNKLFPPIFKQPTRNPSKS